MPDPFAPHIEGERFAGMLPTNATGRALAKSQIVKAGEGALVGFTVYNSGAAQFILVFDSEVVPTNGALAECVFAVAATATVAANWIPARTFRRGIVLANSTTEPTLTLGAADCFFDAQYI